jgi:thiol-disulfide isomerase/thioredoxin
MKLRTLVGAVVGLAITVAASGQQRLSVGDAAPGLDIEKWVKGDQVTITPGEVYVIEFWATWCGPCKRSIPHLTELQKEYADEGLTIIGVSYEEADLVSRFVRGQGAKMGYTVAVDRSEATKRRWFDAANPKLGGIPAAFIVDRKGKIAYIGNPLQDDFETTLKSVMTGRFDAALQRQADPHLNAARNARKLKNWRNASKYYEDVIKLDSEVFAVVALEKFEMILNDMDDKTQAYEYARNTLMNQHFTSDAGALQMLATKISNDPKIDQSKRDLDAALEIAQASQRVAGTTDPAALASVALVRYTRGEVDQAIELQKQAYFNAPSKRKSEYKRVLSIYQGASERSAALAPR